MSWRRSPNHPLCRSLIQGDQVDRLLNVRSNPIVIPDEVANRQTAADVKGNCTLRSAIPNVHMWFSNSPCRNTKFFLLC